MIYDDTSDRELCSLVQKLAGELFDRGDPCHDLLVEASLRLSVLSEEDGGPVPEPEGWAELCPNPRLIDLEAWRRFLKREDKPPVPAGQDGWLPHQIAIGEAALSSGAAHVSALPFFKRICERRAEWYHEGLPLAIRFEVIAATEIEREWHDRPEMRYDNVHERFQTQLYEEVAEEFTAQQFHAPWQLRSWLLSDDRRTAALLVRVLGNLENNQN